MKKPKNICSVEQAIGYKNAHVVDKFREFFQDKFTVGESEDILRESLRWIWLQAYTFHDVGAEFFQDENKAGIPRNQWLIFDRALLIQDEMWHTFILFTKEYYDYSFGCYNQYIHHYPLTRVVKNQFKKELDNTKDTYMESRMKRVKKQMSYVYDLFGEEILKKWYDEFSSKYTPEFLGIKI